jgi:hypothetical protein
MPLRHRAACVPRNDVEKRRQPAEHSERADRIDKFDNTLGEEQASIEM